MKNRALLGCTAALACTAAIYVAGESVGARDQSVETEVVAEEVIKAPEKADPAMSEAEALLREIERDLLVEEYRELRTTAFEFKREARLLEIELGLAEDEEAEQVLLIELKLVEEQFRMMNDWAERTRAEIKESAQVW